MSGGPDLPLNPEDVAEIVALLDGSAYETLELTTPRFVLKVARSESGGWTQDWRHTTSATVAGGPTINENTAAPSTAEVEGLIAIRAPLPGVFYRAPQPGAPPFVEVDGQVGPDTVIGIIETMKMMNSVQAGVAGTIVEIVIANGDMIAKDAVLMRVRPVT
jgi:acetyl-CoA carboxylase biotin carboxyl carrier protein